MAFLCEDYIRRIKMWEVVDGRLEFNVGLWFRWEFGDWETG